MTHRDRERSCVTARNSSPPRLALLSILSDLEVVASELRRGMSVTAMGLPAGADHQWEEKDFSISSAPAV